MGSVEGTKCAQGIEHEHTCCVHKISAPERLAFCLKDTNSRDEPKLPEELLAETKKIFLFLLGWTNFPAELFVL